MTAQELRAKEECEAHHRRMVARRKKQKRDRLIALLTLLGIVLAIFGGGTAFGWHLGTAHMAANSTAEVQSSQAPTIKHTVSPATEAVPVSSCAPVETLLLSNAIVSDGNLLSFELQETMQLLCKEYGIPYALALAVADTESRFDPKAVSKTNDYGIMQINTVNHEWLQEKGIDPLTVEGNIEAGVYLISQKLQSNGVKELATSQRLGCYGEMELALMAYNCGDAGARKLWDAGTYSTSYSRKVMACYEKWLAVLEDA